MFGKFEQPQQYNNDTTIINGTAPVSTINHYSQEVAQYTHGKGKLSCSLKGYDICHNCEEIITNINYDPDKDLDNPCDSIFCSHGAGYNVKWSDVKKYMHIADVFSDMNDITIQNNYSKYSVNKDIFSLDQELMQIFEQTYGPVKKKKINENMAYVISDHYKTKNVTVKQKYNGTEYLLIDGYNVIFSWDKLKKIAAQNIDAARSMLINILCNYQGYKKCEVILVFDAYRVKGSLESIEKVNNISVVYTKEAETADMYIEKVTHQLAKNHKVRVVTSDGLEQLIILGNGALRISSESFYDEIKNVENEIRKIISDTSSI